MSPLPSSRSFRIYHLRGFDLLCQEANRSIDLPQSSLAALIVGVFTTIAIARSHATTSTTAGRFLVSKKRRSS
jgi:hypothetical protein